MARGNYRIPFNPNGSLMHFPGYNGGGANIEWRDNYEFEATLRLDGMRRGRSAKYIEWKDNKGDAIYPMFIADLLDLMKHGSISGGVAVGRWTFTKRGQNYGIRLA